MSGWRVLLVLLLLPSAGLYGQKPPSLGYVYPPALRAGQATRVQLGGYDFTNDLQWFVYAPGVRLEVQGPPGDYHVPPPPYWVGPRTSTPAVPIPREVPATITVDSDVPAGLIRWQVANANGSSTTAVFYVSRGEEILEQRSRDFPQRLPSLPVSVCGRLSRLTEVDRYEMVAEQDGLISIEFMARRLGADFHGLLQVQDESGRVLAEFADTQGVDGGITFAARAGAKYTIHFNDLDFRGDRSYVYRLEVSRGPRVIATIPARGMRGTTREMEFIGMGLASGTPLLETRREPVTFPADASLQAHSHVLKTPAGETALRIPLSDLETQTEAGEAAGAARRVTPPAAVTRRLPPEIAAHQYTWPSAAGERWRLRLESRAIGGSLDVALQVSDPEGNPVAGIDDLPESPDAVLEFSAPKAGDYTCRIRSMSTRTGALDEIYHWELRPSPVDFALSVPQQILLPSGGKADVTVKALRSGGFTGAIQIAVEGLPAGVTEVGEWKIPEGQDEAKLSLQANPTAAVVASPLQFRGTASVGADTVTRIATATAAGNRCPRTPAEQQLDRSLLAMTMPPPFEVRVIDRERQRDVPRGTTYLAPLEIVRKEGFQGPIELHMSAAQARYRCGIRGPIVTVPAEQTLAFYPCFMPEWLGTELTRRMVVHGVAAVPDPQGNLRLLTQPGDSRITMILEGALMKLSTPARDLTGRPGESLTVPVVLARSVKLPLAATVELVVPEEARELVQVEPLRLEPGQDRGELKIALAADAQLEGAWTWTLKATALQDGQWPVVSECPLPVVVAP